MNHAGKQIIVQKQPVLDTETINAISAQLQQAPIKQIWVFCLFLIL